MRPIIRLRLSGLLLLTFHMTPSRRISIRFRLSFGPNRLWTRHFSHVVRTNVCVFYCAHPLGCPSGTNPQRRLDPGRLTTFRSKSNPPRRLLLSPLGYSPSFRSRRRHLICCTHSSQMKSISNDDTITIILLAALGISASNLYQPPLTIGYHRDSLLGVWM